MEWKSRQHSTTQAAREKGQPHSFYIAILLLGLLPANLGSVFIGGRTFITIDQAFHIFFLSGLGIFLLHLLFRKKLNRYVAELALYSFGGWGCIIGFLVLSLNYFIRGPLTKEAYPALPVSEVVRTLEENDEYILPFRSEKHEDFRYMFDWMAEDYEYRLSNPKEIVLLTAKGMFGYDILLGVEYR